MKHLIWQSPTMDELKKLNLGTKTLAQIFVGALLNPIEQGEYSEYSGIQRHFPLVIKQNCMV